jgi:hypothetical protein
VVRSDWLSRVSRELLALISNLPKCTAPTSEKGLIYEIKMAALSIRTLGPAQHPCKYLLPYAIRPTNNIWNPLIFPSNSGTAIPYSADLQVTRL